jgi:hypothetical protein
MPPLALTHLKNAVAARAAELKSSGPVLPTTAPSWMAVPFAGLPLDKPQLSAA